VAKVLRVLMRASAWALALSAGLSASSQASASGWVTAVQMASVRHLAFQRGHTVQVAFNMPDALRHVVCCSDDGAEGRGMHSCQHLLNPGGQALTPTANFACSIRPQYGALTL
jgi:hypothetical protein